MRSLLVIAVFLLGIGFANAQERTWLGQARIFTNDKLGDGQDRWRSGSYGVSFIRGVGWDGANPTGFGDLVEYRVRTEIIAPNNLLNPVLGTDRRYVGALHFGAFSHMKAGAADLVLGLDLVMTGPQTRLGDFQTWVHNALGMGTPMVLGSQIGNAVYPTVSAEFGRDFTLSDASNRRLAFRPFLEAQAGVETFVRIGGDFTFGNSGLGDLQVRDSSTGYRSTAIKSDRARGVSLLFGGDVAYVQGSRYLPVSSGYTVQNPRIRVRAGLVNEGKKNSIFYGLTWLGKEFVNQPTGQVVGSFSVRRKF